MLLAQDRSRAFVCARIHLLLPRIRRVSVPSGRTKPETNFTGRQIGYHRHDSRVKRRRRSLCGCETRITERTRMREASHYLSAERDVTDGDILSCISKGARESDEGKPHVPLLVYGILTILRWIVPRNIYRVNRCS